MPALLANPGLLLIAAGLLLPLLPLRLRQALLLLAPLASMAWLSQLPRPLSVQMQVLGLELTPLHLDALSYVFALIFCIATLLVGIYMLHLRSRTEPAAALVYAGASVAAVLAGDLVTLFIYWELTAIASAIVVLANGAQNLAVTGRYLIVQISSGLLLMAGAIMYISETGNTQFVHLGLDAPGGLLIFLAFGIKAAFPLLHNWLQDTYPAASPTGTVVLSAFTTKLAIYALARGYAGTEILIPIGALMTAFPIFYAVIENDLRKVLAYSLNNQLGFMVVGVGIGTEMALNGTAAHAFTHILYKALLFMSMGAVLLRAGTVNGSDLGGLYRSMPFTTVFCIIGAASISAFPLFSGFVSKSLILSSVAYEGAWFVWLMLLFASAGVFHHSGIKIPYFAFFAHDSGIRCKEAPANMLLAMGLTAAACIGIGCLPQLLYGLLPYAVDYAPYTSSHVLSQTQLLLFSALAFTLLMRTGLYPPELRSTNLDSDWLYRRAAPWLWQRALNVYDRFMQGLRTLGRALRSLCQRLLMDAFSENEVTAVWPIHAGTALLLMLLGGFLLLQTL